MSGNYLMNYEFFCGLLRKCIAIEGDLKIIMIDLMLE